MSDQTEPEVLKIDIWSDVACPWCFIGKRRFESGAEAYAATEGALPVEVEYHSFELAPDTPVDFEGSAADFLAKHKGLPAERVREMHDHVTGLAKAEGLNYDFDAVKQTKTLRAHQLLHLAKEQGKQIEMKERLLQAHFEEGRHVGRIDDLVELATEVGLEAGTVRTALEEERYLPQVDADIAQARAYGIQGVPFFVIDGKYGVSGAQPAEAFAEMLGQVTAERSAGGE